MIIRTSNTLQKLQDAHRSNNYEGIQLYDKLYRDETNNAIANAKLLAEKEVVKLSEYDVNKILAENKAYRRKKYQELVIIHRKSKKTSSIIGMTKKLLYNSLK